MSVQTSVTAAPVAGAPGELYDTSDNNEIISLRAISDTPFGAYVSETAEGDGDLPDAEGEVTSATRRGIALKDPNKASGDGYKAGDMMSVLFRGRAWCLNEEALAFGDTVYVRHVATAPEQLGAFRTDVDGTDAAALPGASVFRAGGVNAAALELNP